MGEQIFTFVNKYISTLSWHRLSVRWEDIVEILIISFLVYHIMTWIKNTKAWVLMKGILIISVFIFLCCYIGTEASVAPFPNFSGDLEI